MFYAACKPIAYEETPQPGLRTSQIQPKADLQVTKDTTSILRMMKSFERSYNHHHLCAYYVLGTTAKSSLCGFPFNSYYDPVR